MRVRQTHLGASHFRYRAMWQVYCAILFLSSTILGQPSCEKSSVVFVWWDRLDVWYVRYDATPCNERDTSRYICEDSGWGNEEATVVCREQGFMYGLGRFVHVEPYRYGYQEIECQGTENTLSECDIGGVSSSHECHQVAVVTDCFNDTHVYVTDLSHTSLFPYHLVTQEGTVGNTQLCIVVARGLMESLFIHVNTTDAPIGSMYPSATAGYDYHPLNLIITFEPTDSLRSEQCLEIDIIDDSLPESWEMFSVILSTNSTIIHLVNPQVDIYIHPNDGPPVLRPNASTTTVISTVSVPYNTSLKSSSNSATSVVSYSPSLKLTTRTSRSLVVSSIMSPNHSTATIPLDITTTSDSLPHSSSGNPSCCLSSNSNRIITTSTSHGIIRSSSSTPTLSHPKPDNIRSTGLVTGVVVSVIVALLVLTIVIVITMILWLRRKTKIVKKKGLQQQSSLSLDKTVSNEEKRLSLTNPTYEPTAFQLVERAETPEHKFMNPLYTPVKISASNEQSSSSRQHNSNHITGADYEYIEFT